MNPNCSLAYGSLGTLLGIMGRSEEAIVKQEIAIRSNPLDPSIFFRFSGLSLAHYMAGRYGSAIEWAESAIHRMPGWFFAHFVLVASHVALDQHQKAAETVRACRDAIPDICILDLDRVPLKDLEKMSELRERLRKAGLPG